MRHPESVYVLVITFYEEKWVRKDGKSGEKQEVDREISPVYFKVRSASKKTLESVLGIQVWEINPPLIQVRNESPTFILSFFFCFALFLTLQGRYHLFLLTLFRHLNLEIVSWVVSFQMFLRFSLYILSNTFLSLAPDTYSADPCFEPRPEHKLSWLGFLMVSVSPSEQVSVQYPN
jgi:hypothetical protein